MKITTKYLAIEFKSYLEMLESRNILPEDQSTTEIINLINCALGEGKYANKTI